MKRTALQEKIYKEIKWLGWSYGTFVKEYDKKHKYQSGLTEDSFKKQLNRRTTRPELLHHYLEFLYSHDKYLERGKVNPRNYSELNFDDDFNQKMKSISALISKRLEDDI